MATQRHDLTDSIGFELPWTAEDSAALRQFIASTAGKRMLGQLILKRPHASERTDPFKRGIQSAVQEGYEEAVQRIGLLCNSEKSVTKDSQNK